LSKQGLDLFEVAAIVLFRHAPQFGNAGRFAKSEVKELRSADRLLALEQTEELGPLLIGERFAQPEHGGWRKHVGRRGISCPRVHRARCERPPERGRMQ
jgi:hypothetical protein